MRAFKVDDEVCRFVDDIAFIEERITIKNKKIRYFNDYLHRLTPDERNYLYERYVEGLDVRVNEAIERITVEEIKEIENAINFIAGEVPEIEEPIGDSLDLNLDDLVNVLGRAKR